MFRKVDKSLRSVGVVQSPMVMKERLSQRRTR